MSPALLLSPVPAFIAGVITSLHCAGMCGPLACALLPAPDPADAAVTASAYQASRLAGYGILGAIAGSLGRMPLSLVPAGILRFVPLLAVVFFLGLAFRWDRRWAKPAFLGRTIFRASRVLGRRSPVAAAALVGLATPFLPCGPLYSFLALALFAGSALRGAEILLSFGLGTLPLLWLAQSQFSRIQSRLTPIWLSRIRMALALVAAIVASWRAAAAFSPGGTPNSWVCF